MKLEECCRATDVCDECALHECRRRMLRSNECPLGECASTNAGVECCEATNALWANVFDLQHLTLNSFRFEVSSASQL